MTLSVSSRIPSGQPLPRPPKDEHEHAEVGLANARSKEEAIAGAAEPKQALPERSVGQQHHPDADKKQTE